MGSDESATVISYCTSEELEGLDIPSEGKTLFAPGRVEYNHSDDAWQETYEGDEPVQNFFARKLSGKEWVQARRIVRLLEVGPHVLIILRDETNRDGRKYSPLPIFDIYEIYRDEGDGRGYHYVSGGNRYPFRLAPAGSESRLISLNGDDETRRILGRWGIENVDGFINDVAPLVEEDFRENGPLLPPEFYQAVDSQE